MSSKSKSAPQAGSVGAPKRSRGGSSFVSNEQARQNSVRNLTRSTIIMAVCTVVSLIVAIAATRSAISQKTAVISVDARGVVTPVSQINSAVLPESRVIGFVENCLRKAYSHDFLHFDMTIPQAQDCFTANAGDRYVMAMQPWISTIKEKRMVMGMVSDRPSRVTQVVERQTEWGRAASWDLESRVSIFLEGKNERIPPQKFLIKVTVWRVPLDVSPTGLLIDKLLSGPADGVN